MDWISTLRDMELAAQDMDRFLRGWPTAGMRRYAYPQVNIWTNEDGAIITSEVPGIDPKKIDLEIIGNQITFTVELPERAAGENICYIRNELQTGKFTRELRLPFNIDADKTSAEYAKGVLRITVKKAEKDKPKKLQIKAD
ncbi:MAG: Hsp20/alpha crystallin family protein [Candidatus Aureabacteria bacterium]|nr:Hsp20/alpha crystallin family protein [Candidatus Auribacterota bacterium]